MQNVVLGAYEIRVEVFGVHPQVPHGRAEVGAGVVLVAAVDLVFFVERGQFGELLADYFQILFYADFAVVLDPAHAVVGNAEATGCFKDGFGVGFVCFGNGGSDHVYFEARFLYRFYGFGQIFGYALGHHVAIGAHGKVYAIEACFGSQRSSAGVVEPVQAFENTLMENAPTGGVGAAEGEWRSG